MVMSVVARGHAADDKKAEKPVESTAPAMQADSITEGTVTVGGQTIAYRAVAGTITVGGTDSQDAMLGLDGKLLPDSGVNPPEPKPEDAPPTARMFYTAYFKKGCSGRRAAGDVSV